MGIYKHCVSMRLDRREIVEVHDDYVVVIEHLTPDPAGPYLVMSNYDEPTWAKRKVTEPRGDERTT